MRTDPIDRCVLYIFSVFYKFKTDLVLVRFEFSKSSNESCSGTDYHKEYITDVYDRSVP